MRNYTLVRDEIAPGTGVDPQRVWRGLEQLINELEPTHSALLEKRDQFQAQLDQWYRAQGAKGIDPQAYRQFLHEIGYLEPEAVGVEVCTENVDREVAEIAGPQLVVPVDNARYVSTRPMRAGGVSTTRCMEQTSFQKPTGLRAALNTTRPAVRASWAMPMPFSTRRRLLLREPMTVCAACPWAKERAKRY